MASLRDLVLGSTEAVVGSLCTGYGGLDLGLLAALGRGRMAWVADSDPHVSTILATRMPGVPNLGDVRDVDWAAVEPVDVVTAGFPCQDISAAGRRAGIEKGERSGIWSDIVAGVRVLRPALLVVENVAALRWKGGGLHRVLGDLAAAGYDALWRSVRASDIGAPHRRERLFLLAWTRSPAEDAADTTGARRQQQRRGRPSTASLAGTSGQPARRGERGGEAAAHANRRGLPVGRHPDGAQFEPIHAQGLRDAHRLGAVVANPDGDQPEGQRGRQAPVGPSRAASSAEDQRQRDGHAAVDRCPAARAGRGQRRVDADSSSAAVGQAQASVDWGEYAAAVHRWEELLGRPAPFPTQPGRRSRQVLSPPFVEHLMGLPKGWITDVPLPRTAQLRALGNGVVPAQAAHALSLLLSDVAALLADEHSTDGQEARAA